MSGNALPEIAEENSAPQPQSAAYAARRPRISWFSRRCPRCEAAQLHRSRRKNGWERMLGVLVLPYRCDFCAHRFFTLRWLGAAR